MLKSVSDKLQGKKVYIVLVAWAVMNYMADPSGVMAQVTKDLPLLLAAAARSALAKV
jgi:hypothetical protein